MHLAETRNGANALALHILVDVYWHPCCRRLPHAAAASINVSLIGPPGSREPSHAGAICRLAALQVARLLLRRPLSQYDGGNPPAAVQLLLRALYWGSGTCSFSEKIHFVTALWPDSPVMPYHWQSTVPDAITVPGARIILKHFPLAAVLEFALDQT